MSVHLDSRTPPALHAPPPPFLCPSLICKEDGGVDAEAHVLVSQDAFRRTRLVSSQLDLAEMDINERPGRETPLACSLSPISRKVGVTLQGQGPHHLS